MKVVAIIPARGGSKGIPRKNVKLLAGKPLIYYTINAALHTRGIDRVIVSTEDEEIAETARKCGAEIIHRPKKLAQDATPTLPVLIHTVRELEKENYKPDAIVLLYATAPLVKPRYIEEGIKKIKDCDSVVSVCEDTRNYKLWSRDGRPLFKKRVNRQKIEKLYRENGAFYIMSYDTLMKKKSVTGKRTSLVFMRPDESVDIDMPLDFILAEVLINSHETD